ncbi:hypothetical protein [Curtobacterium sp. MCBD17_028]|uniref:hypothetical protein n=1 Tax=Curtobacterium sp. MCBD17_028 TaxID=2175670 RepID=UPI000DA9630A|nr:hypothetical protein [Curtobacterium sp. MCBD17_028]PZE27913.1 hypothetical protein DEI86_04770 [Curtobacterium sp. MCBD17_028]
MTVRTQREHRLPARAAVAVAGAAVATVLGATTTAAAAETWMPVPETGDPGELMLMSDAYPVRLPDLSPGDPASWQLHTHVDQHQRVRLDLRLQKDGALASAPDGLRVRVDACQQAWTDVDGTPSCATGGWSIARSTPADQVATQSPMFSIAPSDSDGTVYLLVTLALADTASAASDSALMGLTATVGLGVTATAQDGSAAPAPTAPSTAPPGSAPPSSDPSPAATGGPGSGGTSTGSGSGTSSGTGSATRPGGPAPINASTIRSTLLAFTGGGFLGPLFLGTAVVLAGLAVRWRRADRTAGERAGAAGAAGTGTASGTDAC